MRTLVVISLLTLCFNTWAFKGASANNYGFNAAGTLCQVTVPALYPITGDTGGIPNKVGSGREFCRQLGKYPMAASGFSQTSGYFRHSSDVATTNCALRTNGVASGSVTCQSSASYSTAQ